MKRLIIAVLVTLSLLVGSTNRALAWGRGGGVSFGAVGGARVGGVSGVSAVHVGGVGGMAGGARVGEVGGVRVGGVGAVGGARVGEVGGVRVGAGGITAGHAAMATDFGFARGVGVEGARGFVNTGHFTTPYSGGVLAARGVAVRGGFYHYGAFNNAWWAGHGAAWRPWGWNAANAWGWATWPVLGTWWGWNAQPIYYDYGTTIVYNGDQVFVDGQPTVSAAAYYQQAADLAATAPAVLPAPQKDDQWQPLGVFALVQGDQSDPSAVFQLAVNKAGIIGGNYYNVLTDTTLPVHGAVDKATQRASWIVGDQKTTIYDTGIVNLTKDQAPILIHFGQDRTQQWLLVRVKEQDGQIPAAAKTAPAPAAQGPAAPALITVIVPSDADIFFDGSPTTQTGIERSFSSPPLEPGQNYQYTIRARWTQDGRPVEQTRRVNVKAGDKTRVDFTVPLP